MMPVCPAGHRLRNGRRLCTQDKPMDLANLVLLDERRARAAVAWPLVRRQDQPAPGYREIDGVHYDAQQWLTLSGLDRTDNEHITALFDLGMITADGYVHDNVLAYARRIVAGRMLAKKDRR